MMKLERRHQPLLPPSDFARRMAVFLAFAGGIIGASLGLGIVGFHLSEGLGWLDSLLNASMLLGGMGPVNFPQTEAGKLFASFYALFSGLIILLAFGVMVAPVAHRIFHHFHLPEDDRSA